jgi:transcriptional regulator with XRE-family HTH domain
MDNDRCRSLQHIKWYDPTPEQLAERADIHWTYLSEIETGRKNPSIAVLRKIAGGLEVNLSTLIENAEVLSR